MRRERDGTETEEEKDEKMRGDYATEEGGKKREGEGKGKEERGGGRGEGRKRFTEI